MIRCAQMMLANSLAHLSGNNLLRMDRQEMLSLFIDNEKEPFSIHNLTREGKRLMGKEPGDWYGVNSIA